MTKTQDATETVTVSMDYNTWLEEYKQHGSCTYQGDGGWMGLLLPGLMMTVSVLVPHWTVHCLGGNIDAGTWACIGAFMQRQVRAL